MVDIMMNMVFEDELIPGRVRIISERTNLAFNY